MSDCETAVAPEWGLPPSMRIGRRKAHLWALFQCCNPKTKAKMRENLALAQVLEAECPEVRAAGAWARQIGPHPAKRWGCVSFCWHGCGPCQPGRFGLSGQDRPQQVDLVRGCAGAAWRMGRGPTRRETLAGGTSGACGLSYMWICFLEAERLSPSMSPIFKSHTSMSSILMTGTYCLCI